MATRRKLLTIGPHHLASRQYIPDAKCYHICHNNASSTIVHPFFGMDEDQFVLPICFLSGDFYHNQGKRLPTRTADSSQWRIQKATTMILLRTSLLMQSLPRR